MSYTFEKITEYNAEDFFKCYADTKEVLETNFDFEDASESSDREKFLFFKSRYLKYIQAGEPAFNWKVSNSSGVLMLNCGILNNSHLQWYLALTARDENNSKSWLYHRDFAAAGNVFWEAQGVTKFTVIFANENSDNSIRNYGTKRGSSPIEGDTRTYGTEGIYINAEASE